MPISTSRIYVFNLTYRGKKWLEHAESSALAENINSVIKSDVPKLMMKNIQIINVYEEENGLVDYKCEIHINKTIYDGNGILSKKLIKDLRNELFSAFKKIVDFEFEQIHIVNDEFVAKSTDSFLTGV